VRKIQLDCDLAPGHTVNGARFCGFYSPCIATWQCALRSTVVRRKLTRELDCA